MRMNVRFLLLCLFVSTALQSCGKDENLKVHYLFNASENQVVKDNSGNGYDGKLMDGATIRKVGKYDIMDLGSQNGWLDMGEKTGNLITSLKDFSVATYLYVYPDANITANGNFVWAFSTNEKNTRTTGEYSAYKVNIQRYEQSVGGWANELVGVEVGKPATRGVWMHIVYTQSDKVGKLYIDGEMVATGEAPIQPQAITAPTPFNWLGRAPFEGDINLKAMYYDFRIYDKALDTKEIDTLLQYLNGLKANSMQ